MVRGARSTFSMRALGVIGPSLARRPRTINALFGKSNDIASPQSRFTSQSLNIRGAFKA